ncbi:MAG: ribosomal RNA small subunit methyltransferase A [Phycisphaerae bacterium]|nr:ribosomal RNA small subunit methyltransferase A [Phycisphaerae bacterium]
MQTLTQIRALLDSHGLSPRKALGQNFLIDHNLIRRLLDASGLQPGDLVLEIGPGTGTLTEGLLERGARVVACELDRGLAALLRAELLPRAASFHPQASLTLVEGDCLAGKSRLAEPLRAALGDGPFRLVANLPYGAATGVILALLLDHPRCGSMHVTIQREVADRLLAPPGTSERGPLGIVAQALARADRIADLPAECFWPRPEVASTMVSIVRAPASALPPTLPARALADFCQAMFASRRKQLGSVLGRDFPWPAGVRPEQRIEELPTPAVVALSEANLGRAPRGAEKDHPRRP